MKNKWNRRPQKPKQQWKKDGGREVTVRYGDFDTAMRIWKKKIKKSGILVDLKKKEYFESRSEKERNAKKKAIRRFERRKLKEYKY
ncbi:MAG: 30S ribosomal protein S21 [Euryarchaeota archaeon]|jgi:ribosomal protein S21|nr:30S ribosomal protein S21 [Euryarchaeota archaeon]|tara:strand:+ start:636 stop:893 length:258 start_codon:yes stop_codon:yes gene_type:complete